MNNYRDTQGWVTIKSWQRSNVAIYQKLSQLLSVLICGEELFFSQAQIPNQDKSEADFCKDIPEGHANVKPKSKCSLIILDMSQEQVFSILTPSLLSLCALPFSDCVHLVFFERCLFGIARESVQVQKIKGINVHRK